MRVKIDQIGYIATIIGFIVDTITIFGLLISFNSLEESSLSFSPDILPWIALSVWILGVFTYIGILEAIRKKHYSDTKNLREYIDKILFQKFESPFLFLPAILSFIAFAWIYAYLPLPLDGKIIGGLFLLLGFIGAIGIYGASGQEFHKQVKIEENWEAIRKSIEVYFKRNWNMSKFDLQTNLTWLGISYEEAEYCLSLYASKHPTKAIYTKYHYRLESQVSDDDGWRTYTGLIHLKSVPEYVIY